MQLLRGDLKHAGFRRLSLLLWLVVNVVWSVYVVISVDNGKLFTPEFWILFITGIAIAFIISMASLAGLHGSYVVLKPILSHLGKTEYPYD